MRTKLQELEYLVRCVNAVSDLVHEAQKTRYQTPGQVARVRRWRHVRAALHKDILQLQQTLPPGTQLGFGLDPVEAGYVGHWYIRQAEAFKSEGLNDPLKERVEGRSTPPGKVS